MKKTPRKIKKTKEKKEITEGKIYIRATFNNTIVSITDNEGNLISWATAGSVGFKGARKATPYAASQATKQALGVAKSRGLRTAKVFVSGVGVGREQAIRSLAGQSVRITTLKDISPIPHNGTRPKKVRRV